MGHSEQNRVWCEKFCSMLPSPHTPFSGVNVLLFCVLSNPKAGLWGLVEMGSSHHKLRAHIKVLNVLPSQVPAM